MSKLNSAKSNPNHWYTEDDIADILRLSVPSSVDVFAQTQFEHEDLLTDNFREAIRNVVETGRAQLMPIHLHGNHWAGAIVRMQANGQIQVIYNDPLGEALESKPNAKKMFSTVHSAAEEKNRSVEIIDLRLKQQINGNDCGPFTTDNLIQLASDNGLDGLDSQAILGRRILATPANRSALEIRNTHAEILPRLEDSHVENRTPEKLKERKSRKSDDAFKGDIEKLLNLKSKISDLKTAPDKDRQIKILTEIGEIASSIYRKEIDKSAIRNRFSSNEQNKKNILYLDALELLTHLKTDRNRVNDNSFESALPDVISDLEIISENIDAVLSEEQNYDRAKKILPKDEMLKDVESIRSAEPKENATNPQNLKAFIASFYVPKALERMRQLIPLNQFLQRDELSVALSYVVPNNPEYNWDDRIDRYSLARTLIILGELSRDIRHILPKDKKNSDQNADTKISKIFGYLNDIRNNLKMYSTAHPKKQYSYINFFSEGNRILYKKPDKNIEYFFDLSVFDSVLKAFEYLDYNLKFLEESYLKINDDSIVTSYQRILNSAILNKDKLEVISEFSDILYGTDKRYNKLKKLLSDASILKESITKKEGKESSKDQLFSTYNEELAKIQKEDASKLPKTLEDIKRLTYDLKEYLKNYGKDYVIALGQIKSYLSSSSEIEEMKEKLDKSLKDYSENYLPLKDLPNPSDEDAVTKYLEKIKKKIDDKNSKKDSDSDQNNKFQEDFLEHCTDFQKEIINLKSITSFTPQNEEQKQRHEFAVAHSVGMIGEAIRYLFEIDDETNFLGEFARRALVEDINETRMVRNKQVMHGTFNYDSDAVFRAATQNTTPWEHDIKAIGLVHEFITLMSREGDYIDHEAVRLGLTSDQMQMRMAMFVGASYVRLGQIDKASEVLEDAKSIALSNKDEPAIEEIIRINNLLAAIERKNGISTTALDLIEESLLYVAEYPQYKNEEAQLLNNKATIISEVGDNEEAKELYKKAMDQGFVPAAISLGQTLCKEKKYGKAIDIYREQFLKINPERKERPFEFILILRGLWLAQSEDGQHENAERTFNNYVNFYRKNLPLFKEHCGQGYENVEAMILHDEGSNLYCEGHYTRAINRLENALSLLDETGIRTSRDVSHMHLNIANCYKYLASKFSLDRSEVAEYRKMAIQHYEDAIKSSDHDQSIDVAHANAGLAEIYANMRKGEKSNEHKKAAKDGFEKHGDIGKKYSEVLDNSTRAIDANHNSRSRPRGTEADDEYALFQGGLMEVGNAMKSNRNEEALDLINNQIDEAKRLGVVSPPVIQLNFQKFICHCRLGQQQKALEAYSKLHDLVESHPDCADHSYRDYANRVFQSNFRSSLPSVNTPTGSLKPTDSGKLSSQSKQR